MGGGLTVASDCLWRCRLHDEFLKEQAKVAP